MKRMQQIGALMSAAPAGPEVLVLFILGVRALAGPPRRPGEAVAAPAPFMRGLVVLLLASGAFILGLRLAALLAG